jgi:tetratricopeptide (TPR) repeat protein
VEHRSQPDFQLACPVCSAFNSADFRFCPHCGHRLGAPDLIAAPETRRRRRGRFSTLIFLLLLLAVGVELAWRSSLWQDIQTLMSSKRPPASPSRPHDAGDGGSDADQRQEALRSQASKSGVSTEAVKLPAGDEKTAPQTSRQAQGSAVEVTLFDREGDVLRKGRGILSGQERRVLMTFKNIHGAYSGVAHLPDNTTPSITAVERADPVANLAILWLDPLASASSSPLPSLEALAHTTYEETPAEQRYLAEKRAGAQRWDEALGHWKRLLEMDNSLRREVESSLAEAFLNSSAAAQSEGRRADAHARLLDAVEWLPEHGDMRLRLAGSLVEVGEYREAIEQYWVAYDLLPLQAPDIVRAIVHVYRGWGQELLRQGDFAAAANLFREALQLDSGNGELYFALGLAEFRRLAFDAAIEAFQAAQSLNPGLRGEVEPYLTKARALRGGPQTAVINFAPGSTRIEVSVVINGRIEVPFIIDTGASMTLMPLWAADMLGYRAQAASDWIRVQTAGGPRRLPYAAVSRIEIQGLGVSNLPVLFGDLPGYDAGVGLLGMDFLRYFSLAVDHDIGRMTLRLK